ncbi:MAG: hypothetical protein ABI662_12855 [Dermatophilaceae bacterium]
MDRATDLRLRSIDQVPGVIDEKIGHLFALFDERFKLVATQFAEREVRSDRESRDNKVAVDAAFAAQKEAAAKEGESNQKAIDKSENATNETIRKNADLFESRTAALASRLEDTKETFVARLAAVDLLLQGVVSNAIGVQHQRQESRASGGTAATWAGFAVGFAGLVATIVIVAITKR